MQGRTLNNNKIHDYRVLEEVPIIHDYRVLEEIPIIYPKGYKMRRKYNNTPDGVQFIHSPLDFIPERV